MNTHRFKTPIRKTLKPKSSPSSSSPAPSSSLSQSEFTFTITKTAVSQICQHIGYKSSSLTAIQTLTQIATIYLQSLAKIAADHAASSNRTECNLFDVVASLEDLASVLGFRGAARTNNNAACTLNSSILTDIMNFVDYTDELPFAKPIPRLDSSCTRKRNPTRKSGCSGGSSDVGRSCLKYRTHIPPWLPPLPDRKTYEDQLQRRVLDSFEIDKKLSLLINNDDDLNDLKASSSKSVDKKRKGDVMRLPERRVKVRFKLNSKRSV